MSRQSEKTEQPTPKRLRDARQKGQVARSQELVTSISLFAIIGTLWFGWSAFYSLYFCSTGWLPTRRIFPTTV